MEAFQGGQVGGLDQLQQCGNEVAKVLQAEAVGEVRQALQGWQEEGKFLPQMLATQLLACAAIASIDLMNRPPLQDQAWMIPTPRP